MFCTRSPSGTIISIGNGAVRESTGGALLVSNYQLRRVVLNGAQYLLYRR